MHLYLANKLYSSWSMRPWLVMRHIGLDFEEAVIPLRREDTKARILEVSPSGKLPVLVLDNGVRVWDSMAIISFLSDLYPDRPIWPESLAARGHAKAICLEMHSGFQTLRQACPMNLGKRFKPRDFGHDVDADVARISTIWRDTRERFGSKGPFLFGAFTAADAVYAPVVNRLSAYGFKTDDDVRAYMDAIEGHTLYREWRDAGLAEPWHVPDYEEGHTVDQDLRADFQRSA
ncbi:MAG: glutathione S-transferase family protein [Pseudomonadota bacterium]